MTLEDDTTPFPLADYDPHTDAHPGTAHFQHPKHHRKPGKKSKAYPPDSTDRKKTDHSRYTISSYHYFENTEEENNLLTLIPYTGPCNTSHLGINLYLPQVTSTITGYSSVGLQRFVDDYTRTVDSIQSSEKTKPISVYIRFGILYVLVPDLKIDRSMPLKDFLRRRHEGESMKTAFYSCKGVTTPKTLLAAITKLNYQQLSSNVYSYSIQLYGTKNNPYSVLLFRYDEQLRCQDVSYQTGFPTNFNFIRDKTSSKFRSVDHSYADIFDFRVQIAQDQRVSQTDPHVLEILRDVPIDSVLSFDPSTRVLQIYPRLRKFVKYFKCTRSSNYQNLDDHILLSIGMYEEYEVNNQGQCEPMMVASNMMTMEFLDSSNVPSAKELYDTGMWFSKLCQSCVELPSATLTDAATSESNRWFSAISAFRKKTDRTIAAVNVNELTRYTTRQSKKTCTSEDLTLIKKILHEGNPRRIFFDEKEDSDCKREELERRWQNLKKKLQMAGSAATHASKKAQRAYCTLLREMD